MMLRRTIGALLVVAATAPWTLWSEDVQAQGTPMPWVRPQFFTTAGAVCSGCLLNAYTAGTTTRLDTFSNITLTTANANPVVMDSAGYPTTGYIFLSATTYRFVLTDSTGGTTYFDYDNAPAIPATAVGLDITGTAGEALSAGDIVYLSDGSGSLTAGRWYQADADNDYESSTATQIGFVPTAIASGSSGSIRIGGRATGLSGLTAGEDYYVSATAGAVTGTPPTNARFVGRAESTTVLVIQGEAGALRIPDSDGTHQIVMMTTSNLTANRRVALLTGDRAVTVTFNSADVTLPQALQPGLTAVRVYTASDTWTKPSGLHSVVVWVVGGGGGSGGVDTTAGGQYSASGAGGGGGTGMKRIIAAALGATETVTVGAAGTAGAAGDNDGVAGGTSSFGSHVSATGGGGGAGGAGGAATIQNLGGTGGSGSSGDLNLTGAAGGMGFSSSTLNLGAIGGASSLGGGGRGGLQAAGSAGGAYGGGGGGTTIAASTSATAGAAGAGGVVIVYEYSN